MSKKGEAPTLVVRSAMKDFVAGFESDGANMRSAGDLAEALDTKVAELLEAAVNRAVSNGRKTVTPGDL